MKLGVVYRGVNVSASNLNTNKRTLDLIFSSADPIRQSFGKEVLSHDPGAVDLSRMAAAAPMLWNQDVNELIGVVESAYIGNDKRGHATVRFSSSDLGKIMLQDVEDRIIRWASVGYRIKSMTRTEGNAKNPDFTVTRWQPIFISLVSIPPDATAGFTAITDAA